MQREDWTSARGFTGRTSEAASISDLRSAISDLRIPKFWNFADSVGLHTYSLVRSRVFGWIFGFLVFIISFYVLDILHAEFQICVLCSRLRR